MNMETFSLLLGLLLNPTSSGPQPWLHLWTREFLGLCATNLMPPILLWGIFPYVEHELLTTIPIRSRYKLLLVLILFVYNFSAAYLIRRLTLAMDFTVINSLQILTISPKCGLRTGVDGRLSNVIVSRDFLVTSESFCLDNLDYFILGFFPLVEPCHTDPLKILHLLWHAFTRLVEVYKITTWYSLVMYSFWFTE